MAEEPQSGVAPSCYICLRLYPLSRLQIPSRQARLLTPLRLRARTKRVSTRLQRTPPAAAVQSSTPRSHQHRETLCSRYPHATQRDASLRTFLSRFLSCFGPPRARAIGAATRQGYPKFSRNYVAQEVPSRTSGNSKSIRPLSDFRPRFAFRFPVGGLELIRVVMRVSHDGKTR
jgi:hypothetical protein